MKFTIPNTGENLVSLMRKAGYFALEQRDKDTSFIRPLERSGYPRFHIYLKIDESNNQIIFNLHLDQKRPVYKNAPAHAGEYEGAIVENETQRIKQSLQ